MRPCGTAATVWPTVTNCVKTYTMACRGVLSSAPLKLMGSRPLVAFGDEALTTRTTSANNYTRNPVGRSLGTFSCMCANAKRPRRQNDELRYSETEAELRLSCR
jgi:hypothetical protein